MEPSDDPTSSKRKDDLFRRIQDRRDARSATAGTTNATAKDNEQATHEIDSMIREFSTRLTHTDNSGLDPSKDFLAVTEALDGLNKELQGLERHFKERAAQGMPKYDVERTQKSVSEVRAEYLRLQDRLQPKKKFGFKGRKSAKPASAAPVSSETATITPSKSTAGPAGDATSFRITNPEGKEVVIVPSSDVFERDVVIDGLTSCTVHIPGVPSTVHVTNVHDVTILCGPVQTSVFIEHAAKCTFALACQQLRTHSTTESKFYLKVTSKGIIEDCNGLQFAPYNLDYSGREDDFSKSGLSPDINNWNDIDDFNWLHSGKQSPNWSLLPEEKRQSFSM